MKKDAVNKFFLYLNDILLWAFIISMVALALLYIFNPNQLRWEVLDESKVIGEFQGMTLYQNQTSLPIITQEEMQAKKDFYDSRAFLAAICILGWMAVHPRFKKNFMRLFKELEDVKE